MKTPLATLALFACSACAFAQAPDTRPLPDYIAQQARRVDFNGVVLVEKQGRLMAAQAFGLANREFGIRNQVDTKFRIASITKLFTAVLVMQQVDKNRIRLDGTIGRYLPDYAGEAADKVSVRQLLSHTSGIANSDTVKSFEEAVENGIPMYQLPLKPAELVRKFASGPLVKTPGTTFDYNNADYFILGRILESVTGKTFQTLLDEQILQPLGMRDTGMHRAMAIVPGIATPYLLPDPKAGYLNQLPAYPENWYAAGGMFSTAGDLRKFSAALYGGRLVSKPALKQMLTPVLEEYAFGQWVADTKVRGKPDRLTHRPGSIMGANTVLIHYLGEDLTVIVLSNTNGTNIDRFGFGIAKQLARP